MLFGSVPAHLREFLLDTVLKLKSTGRYRDVHIVRADDDEIACYGKKSSRVGEVIPPEELLIRVFTRDGGNNRRCSNGPDYYQYPPSDDESEDAQDGQTKEDVVPIHDCIKCECTGCNQMHYFPSCDTYVDDEDCTWDTTYAYTYFRIPDEHKNTCKELYLKSIAKYKQQEDSATSTNA
jgi:hypothetical protein